MTEQKATSKAATCSNELQKMSPMDPTGDDIDRGPAAMEGGKVIGAPEPAASQPANQSLSRREGRGVRPRQDRSKHQNMQSIKELSCVCGEQKKFHPSKTLKHRNPVLRPSILTLHIIQIRRVVLALIIICR